MAAADVFLAAVEIDRAADLFSDSAGWVHDNERRWRVFRERIVSLTRSAEAPE